MYAPLSILQARLAGKFVGVSPSDADEQEEELPSSFISMGEVGGESSLLESASKICWSETELLGEDSLDKWQLAALAAYIFAVFAVVASKYMKQG